MSIFILKSACNGRRPSKLVGISNRQRPHIVAQLLRERSVARFVSAPSGYGKTAIAVEYAETIFSWVHVFWINCQSPCFVRDLDAGAIASECLRSDSNASLVIFDSVPALGQVRSEALSNEIDALLEAKCEVIVTCSPIGDAYGTLQRDRLLVSGQDLLLNDDEIDAIRSADERLATPAYEITPANRVPALAWSEDGASRAAFLKNAFGSDAPAELALSMATMLILQYGSLSKLTSFGTKDPKAMEELLEAYPHLCADFDVDQFNAPAFEIREIAPTVKKHLDRIARQSKYNRRGDLVRAWAEELLATKGSASRACDVVRELCTAKDRIQWLADQSFNLLKTECLYACHKLIESVRKLLAKEPMSVQTTINAADLICLHLLGDTETAVKRAKKFGFASTSAHDAQIYCLLLVIRFGPAIIRPNALENLRSLLKDPAMARSQSSFAAVAARGQMASIDGIAPLAELWMEERRNGASANALGLIAIWILETRCSGSVEEASLDKETKRIIAEVEQHAFRELESVDAIGSDLITTFSGFALEKMRTQKLSCSTNPLPAPILLGLRQAEVSLASQRRMLEQDARQSRIHRRNWLNTHPDSLASSNTSPFAPSEQRSVPILSIKLFGRFEVSIGGESVDPSLFKRQSVCTLLAILALNHNREVMRDSLARSLWPKSSSKLATKNFYTVWSQLKKALTLADGTCPYLIRHQYGCRLDSRYVQSDIERFDQICHELLFAEPDIVSWPAIFSEIKHDFMGELVPGDASNSLICSIRSETSVRLTDALLSAARGIVSAEYPQWGIWFARAAIERDRTREDAYATLMQAQKAANQRTAAMMTYLKCQRMLADELGIDPSPTTRTLYQELLNMA